MNTDLLTVAVLGFFSGYILKSIVVGWKTFSVGGNFVRQLGYKTMMLLGSSVYKMSYVDQVCAQMVEEMGSPEEAKQIRLQYQQEFAEWKQDIAKEFVENYPEEYQWQLEFDDWEGMMKELAYIYKERKV